MKVLWSAYIICQAIKIRAGEYSKKKNSMYIIRAYSVKALIVIFGNSKHWKKRLSVKNDVFIYSVGHLVCNVFCGMRCGLSDVI